ncbi:MAG: phosphate acyltransferase PlsX [Oscillospiraceae bacterium]|nr:phosphate acyltransferase PlsX [Oscillospiraceae bacterium]
MRIIIDAMGGDNAPGEIVKGAVEAIREFGVSVTLVGKEAEVGECLKKENAGDLSDKIKIVNASEIVKMDDDPTTVLRAKKDSSMAVALRLLKDGEGDACISAGSTGALLTGATLIVKRVNGIRRAALAPVLPNGGRGVMLIDCGANVDCTPEYLLQFAFMGSFYSKRILGCDNPRIGLLNVGTEDTKGGELQNQAFKELKEAGDAGHINFIGNVEAKDVLFNSVDVVVTDGFSGNIMLKTIEGTGKFIMNNLKDIFTANRRSMVAALAMKKRLGEFKKKIDPSEVGGTALLGISRPVIKAHGASDSRALKNAVLQAVNCVNTDVAGEIAKNIELMTISKAE